MDASFLILEESTPTRLFIARNAEERDQIIDTIGRYRISPIFAVSEIGILPESDKFTVSFFMFESNFETIGRIEQMGDEVAKCLWFTYGLASLVVFGGESITNAISSKFSNEIRAQETWNVECSTIIPMALELVSPTSFELENFRVNHSVTIDTDTGRLLADLRHGIDVIVHLAAQYTPKFLPIMERLVFHVNELISRIVELRQRLDEAVLTNSIGQADRIQKTIHVRTDHLIQINSVLAYTESQAFGGAIPILQSRSHVHSHSLFGIGSAVLALHAFTRHVDEAFGSASVRETLKKSFPVAGAMRPFRSLGEVDLDAWADQPDAVDQMIESRESTGHALRPHLMFFSGRLGFQESPNSISAATQALPSADCLRWSLMTLSHEVTHSHVRDLLGSIMANAKSGETEEDGFARSYEVYKNLILRSEEPPNLIESIRCGLFNYCRFRYSMAQIASSAEKSVKFKDEMPDMPQLKRLFESSFRDMNEIMVHALDFHYFYAADAMLYIDYLWESWSTVPAVGANPEFYILRTIAAISTSCKGGLDDRFDRAKELISNSIKRLSSRFPKNVLLTRVNGLLEEKSSELKIRSLPNQYLAEITIHSLFSSKINSKLVKDKFVNIDEDGEPLYVLRPGSFPGESVTSPVSLLVDRIKRRSLDVDSDECMEFRSAWLFLAVASAMKE